MSEVINYKPDYTEPQAKREVVDILEEEANQLASLGTFPPEEYEKKYPPRVRIAISREIIRLRALAKVLKP